MIDKVEHEYILSGERARERKINLLNWNCVQLNSNFGRSLSAYKERNISFIFTKFSFMILTTAQTAFAVYG